MGFPAKVQLEPKLLESLFSIPFLEPHFLCKQRRKTGVYWKLRVVVQCSPTRTAAHELPELGLVWKTQVKNFPSDCRGE